MKKEMLWSDIVDFEWPFPLRKSVLVCMTDSGGIVVKPDATKLGYGINGPALSCGYPELPDYFWRDNALIPGTKISLTGIIRWANENLK